jgi:hypothetical protein
MTNREFYTAIVEGKLTAEVQEFANSAIVKLDNRNANRSAKPSKTQQENAPIKQALHEYIVTNGGAYTEGELGEALGITHNKAGALARQLVAEGLLKADEVKIPKVGKRKVYSIAVAEVVIEGDED